MSPAGDASMHVKVTFAAAPNFIPGCFCSRRAGNYLKVGEICSYRGNFLQFFLITFFGWTATKSKPSRQGKPVQLATIVDLLPFLIQASPDKVQVMRGQSALLNMWCARS